MFRRIQRIYEFRHDKRQFFKSDGFGDVRIEARLDAFRIDVAEDVCGECDDRVAPMAVLLFPASDLFAGLVAIFIWHVEIALRRC